jgi:hypothetical protein
MAPEQFQGEVVDSRTDQFAFCVALYEGLFGERPFVGSSLAELAEAVTHGRIVARKTELPIPDSVYAALLKGLSVDPSARFGAMDELLAALAVVRQPLGRPAGRWSGVKVALALGAVAITALLGIFVAMIYTVSRSESPPVAKQADSALEDLIGDELIDGAAAKTILCNNGVCVIQQPALLDALISKPERLEQIARPRIVRKNGEVYGLKLYGVHPESAAARFELRNSDMIIAVDGKPLATWRSVEEVLLHLRNSTTSSLTYERAGEPHIIALELPGSHPNTESR